MGWWRRRPEVFRDAVGAVPLVLTFLLAQQIYGAGGPWSRAVTIVAVMWGALAVRRRWPILTFAAALLTVVLAMTGLEFLAVAGYTLVAYRPRIPATFVVVVSAATTTAGFLRWWPSLEPAVIAGDLILILGVSILPAVLGKAIRRSRRVTAELQTRNAELVALREEAAEHAVQRERFRIARDLHDVVAHHVSAMTVRAGAGHHVASRDPQAAVDALDYVAHEGADALAAMGSLVGTLRGETGTEGIGDTSPQPGLGDIPALVDTFRGTGLAVHTDIHAPPGPLAPGFELAVFRVMQEALTNVLRHSGAEGAWVRVWSDAEELRIQVDDDGRGLPAIPGRAGHGLIGVSERVALHGGTSELRPSPHGGCRLQAMLHLPDFRAAAADPTRPSERST
jgi:signal transduction histidine kinase